MAENDNTESVSQTTSSTEPTESAEREDDKPLGPAGEGALKKERAEAKRLERELKSAMNELQTLRDRDKTEAQKLEERAAAAEKAATHAQSQLIRYQVAAEKGLPAELAARLQGTDARELAADADKLLELFAAKTGGAPAFNGGPRKTADAPADMNALIRGRTGRG